MFARTKQSNRKVRQMVRTQLRCNLSKDACLRVWLSLSGRLREQPTSTYKHGARAQFRETTRAAGNPPTCVRLALLGMCSRVAAQRRAGWWLLRTPASTTATPLSAIPQPRLARYVAACLLRARSLSLETRLMADPLHLHWAGAAFRPRPASPLRRRGSTAAASLPPGFRVRNTILHSHASCRADVRGWDHPSEVASKHLLA